MKMSSLLNHTLRESPARGDPPGVNFLVRAGYLQPVSPGTDIYLPLGVKTIQKMVEGLRQSLAQSSVQEVSLPPLLSPEDSVAEISLRNIQSYRQLPRQFFCLGVGKPGNFKNPARFLNNAAWHRFSLFSLSATQEEMEQQSSEQFKLLQDVLQKGQLPFLVIPNGSSRPLAGDTTEIIYPSELGEQTILSCPSCGYTANQASARFHRGDPPEEDLLPLEEVHTPGAHTIQALADYLQVTPSRTAKAVMLMASTSRGRDAQSPPQQFIFAVVRGDLELDEDKLAGLLDADSLRPASEAEIRAAGAEPGYASPIGLKNIRIVVDESIPLSPNLVAGANRPDHHLRNVNYGRDYTASQTADIAAAWQGAPCPHCRTPLSSRNGVLLGCQERWYKSPSEYLDSEGKPQSICVSSAWLDLDTILACTAQQHHDDKGLLMPAGLAPYPVYMVVINSKDGSSEQAAEKLYRELTEAGLEVLLDDRSERAGVKFNDADLIGLPLRITVSERNLLENRVEIKPRNAVEAAAVPLDQILNHVLAALRR